MCDEEPKHVTLCNAYKINFDPVVEWRLAIKWIQLHSASAQAAERMLKKSVEGSGQAIPRPKNLQQTIRTRIRLPWVANGYSLRRPQNRSSLSPKPRNVVPKQGFEYIMSNYGSQEVVVEEDLYLEGIGYVTAVLLPNCLTWHLAEPDDEVVGSFCWGRKDTEKTLGQVPISEVYSSEMYELGRPTSTGLCGGVFSAPLPQMHRFAVYTFQRSHDKKCNWIPKVFVFCHESAEVCQAWVAHLQRLLDQGGHRPKNLLVLINPFGGNRTGVQTWESVAPMFERARVRTKVILTERAGHAHDIMAKASEEDLKAQDGVVVVGGDGLFNEVLNGLVMKRHKSHAAPKPQWVSEVLGKAPRVEKKSAKDSRKRRESSQPQDTMDTKHEPLGSSYDVHAPLLKKSSFPVVDTSTSIPVSSTESSSNSASERLFESKAQKPAVETVPTDVATGTEIELSKVDSDNSSRVGLTPEAGILEMEGQHSLPVAMQGVTNPSGKDDPDAHSFTLELADIRFLISIVKQYILDNVDGVDLPSLTDIVPHNNSRISDLHLRVGIIPAGSTDTVAISTTGSRDPITAALHILLGDSMPLDIVRITSWKKSLDSEDEPPTVRYAASFAGYGFYGDVMKESERTRWMGPARYDIAGAKVFMKHKKYMAEVSFLEMPTSVAPSVTTGAAHKKLVCRDKCSVCSEAIDLNHLVSDGSDGEEDSAQQPAKATWRTRQDSFHSIGAAVMSCRNDKAPDGLSAHAHLADGLLHLILIKSCSRANYLRQLITLTRKGADPFDFDFVEHYKTPVFAFTSHGEESIWNVDGELFPAHQLSAQCFRGLVTVFARGPEF